MTEVNEAIMDTAEVEPKPARGRGKAVKDVTPEDLSQLTTAQQLARQKKVQMTIPPRTPNDAFWYGMINDCPLAYPVGELIEVPEDVAKLIRGSLQLDKATDAFAKAHKMVAQ